MSTSNLSCNAAISSKSPYTEESTISAVFALIHLVESRKLKFSDHMSVFYWLAPEVNWLFCNYSEKDMPVSSQLLKTLSVYKDLTALEISCIFWMLERIPRKILLEYYRD